jgi:hypothetical protein
MGTLAENDYNKKKRISKADVKANEHKMIQV